MEKQTDDQHKPPERGDGVEKGEGASEAKRRKVVSNLRATSLIGCSKGRVHHGSAPPKENVLHLPPRLTKSAYQTLLSTHVAPRQWHLEGRYGSRTHKVDGTANGIPVLHDRRTLEDISLSSPELKQLLDTKGVDVVEKDFVHNHRSKQDSPDIDARVHPELEPANFVLPSIVPKQLGASDGWGESLFTYAEMFGGIGGFGVALDRLGGACTFYSEIDERCRETYSLNFDTKSSCIHGDIYDVPDEAFPQNLDMLVAGFPCQPFSALGDQPGFDCEKGRGQLFLQIVRALKLSKPKCFLFENVPGLLGMKDTLDVILSAFRGAGYRVSAEVCSARGLTATIRKRLFFVGVREDLVKSNALNASDVPKEKTATDTKQDDATASLLDTSFFQFPYIPDLKLCCHDIIDYDELPAAELDVLRLSESTWDQLSQNKKWKPANLAWPNRHCDTLTSHYGNAVGRGDSQLVPSSCPHPPRRFSVRECARLMGFPNTFTFSGIRPEQGEMAHRKEGYRMVGNAVCPPLIAVLAGSVLNAAGIGLGARSDDHDLTAKGRRVAVDLACAVLRSPVALPAGCLVTGPTKEESAR